MSTDLRTNVLLSLQRALLGEITPQMRAVAVQWSPQQIDIRVYTDGESTYESHDAFDATVVTEVMADFPVGGPKTCFEFVRCDAPTSLPDWGQLVYVRAERG